MLHADQLEALRDYAAGDPNVAALYLFGSEASDRSQPGSDVDLAIMLREPVDGFRRIRMETELSNTIGRDVDLVVFDNASPLLKHQILKAQTLLYEGDLGERIRQETWGRYEFWDTRFLHQEIRTDAHG